MADEGIQPGLPAVPAGMPPPAEAAPTSVRPGAPGTATDFIPLARTPVKKAAGKDAAPEIKDSFREVIETIVFVVVLVLMLKTFLAEAFVIPTGSMATTLLG